ncbi:MAG: FecR domain-containing protein [Alphaproteobacteria bacterium]
MRFASFGALLAVCFLLGSGCSKGVSRTTAATVFFVNGNVVFGSAERHQFQPVTSSSTIPNGDTIRTAQDATINLALVPGVFVRLSGNSEIKIDQLRLVKDGNETAGGMLERRSRVQLKRGKMSVLFSRPDRSASYFTVTTNQSTITPDSDSLFTIWTDGSTTRVTCGRGEVIASGNGQSELKIAAGYFHQWPMASNEPVAATADAGAQMDTRTSFEAEKELLDQAAGRQDRRPF